MGGIVIVEEVLILRPHIATLEKATVLKRYMAEWTTLDDGAILLIENHCSICAAARICQGFCRSELDLFGAVLGKGVMIKRVDHIVSGARRCAYRIIASKIEEVVHV